MLSISFSKVMVVLLDLGLFSTGKVSFNVFGKCLTKQKIDSGDIYL